MRADALLVDVICYGEEGDVAVGPPDAVALALRIRALAAALGTLLPDEGALDAWERTRKAAHRRSLARHGAVLVAPDLAFAWPHDTS